MEKKHDLTDLAYKYLRVIVLLLVAANHAVDLVSKVVNYVRSVSKFRLFVSPKRQAGLCA